MAWNCTFIPPVFLAYCWQLSLAGLSPGEYMHRLMLVLLLLLAQSWISNSASAVGVRATATYCVRPSMYLSPLWIYDCLELLIAQSNLEANGICRPCVWLVDDAVASRLL